MRQAFFVSVAVMLSSDVNSLHLPANAILSSQIMTEAQTATTSVEGEKDKPAVDDDLE